FIRKTLSRELRTAPLPLPNIFELKMYKYAPFLNFLNVYLKNVYKGEGNAVGSIIEQFLRPVGA
ncbi:MAG: hypothetical protein WCO98_17070, partial [bacterium]